MRVSDLVAAMERIAPPELAESWDNVGLILGDPAASLSAVMLTIDLSPEVGGEAASLGCEAAVAYHPPIFAPVRRVVAGDPAFAALQAGLAVYSPHTALDVADGGTNDALCDLLGLEDRRPLRPREPGGPGPGRIGVLAQVRSAAAIADRVKAELELGFVLCAGPEDREVRRVAVCAGAGGSLVDDAVAAGADLYLVGELGHHDALRAARLGLTAVCTLHSNTERLALPGLAERLRAALPELEVHESRRDRDPFRLC